MSKKFKAQDYFRYPKLGKKWRKPRGLQSKLRLRKGGSGMHVAVGYGKKYTPQPLLVRCAKDLENCPNGVIFSSGLGSRKTAMLTLKAKEKGIRIFNMRKVKRAARLEAALKKRSAEKKKEAKIEKKMGFFEEVVPQVLEKGKTKTYRLRDHGLKAGDAVAFENTQKKEVFGHAKITNVEKTTVGKLDLKDPGHHRVYDKVDELVEAFKRHYPDKDVTTETDAWVYTYEFTPAKKPAAKKEKK